MNNPAGEMAAAAAGPVRAGRLLIYGVRTRSVTCTCSWSLRATQRYCC